MRQIIADLGGWPVLMGDKWKGENVSLVNMYRKLFTLGLSDDMIIHITVIPHSTNFSRNMLAVS